MLHGNPATCTLWRPLIERLAGRRTIYAIDLPGFGGSPAPQEHAGYSLVNIASVLLEFARLHRLERFDLVGHSFGGAIAITLADMAPERIRSLAAITPMTDRIPPLARLARHRVFEQCGMAFWGIMPGSLRRMLARQWTHVSYGRGYSRPRAEEVAREVDRADIVGSLCGLVVEADYQAYGAAISRQAMRDIPMLLAGSEEDRIIPLEHFERLCRRLPRAERHIFPHGSHVPMWQYPDETAHLLATFWEKRR